MFAARMGVDDCLTNAAELLVACDICVRFGGVVALDAV